ncbi:hypothetical protein AMTR_s00017p00248510 [Amborella trichopoda]|uniref:FBD domain-containing protein n=1 Tax=Amborella trichopoda TaxID=13333 RepID=W1PNM5_AMBTC|nr:hypothetical protein AMTR_s00017p00248510 [Amborella trichopoda]
MALAKKNTLRSEQKMFEPVSEVVLLVKSFYERSADGGNGGLPTIYNFLQEFEIHLNCMEVSEIMGLVCLLKKFPNLNALCLKDYEEELQPEGKLTKTNLETLNSDAMSCLAQLKKLKLVLATHCDETLDIIEFFLLNAGVLDEFFIKIGSLQNQEEKSKVAERLDSFPKASPEAKIIFS